MSVADTPAVGMPAGAPEDVTEPVEPYFWEEGGDRNVDWWAKVKHSLHFGGVKALAGAEAIGEVVANTLGLNDSKYQYVIDALEADEMRAEREQRDEDDRKKVALEAEASRAKELENQQDGEAKEDGGAIELGDTTLTLPGRNSGAPPPQGSTV